MEAILNGDNVDDLNTNIYHIFAESFNRMGSTSPTITEVDGKEFSYTEMKELVEKLTSVNLKIGLTSNVGLFIANGVARCATILSLSKLGITFVPLSPVMSKDEISNIIEEAQITLVLVGKDHNYPYLWQQYGTNIKPCVIDDNSIDDISIDDLNRENCIKADRKFDSEDIFCIIYTSGSTGIRKGVKLSHGNIINRLSWYWRQFPFREDDISCSKSSVLFLDYYTETFSTILKCQSLIFLQQHHVKDYTKLFNYLYKYNITRLVVVPSLLKVMTDIMSNKEIVKVSLSQIICSGENLPNRVADDFLDICPDVELYNLYGSTEVTGDVLFARMVPKNTKQYECNTLVGLPIDNIIVYIVNNEEELVTNDNDTGELWVSGKNVSKGYVDQSKNNSFVKNPFSDNENFQTAYKTSDYVKLSPQGLLYVGRKDDVIKVRGHKVSLIELQEIIQIILPSSKVCVVSKFVFSKSVDMIYAFISNCDKMKEDELLLVLKEKLPYHKMPRIIFLSQMPLQASTGKIDKTNLKEMITTIHSKQQSTSLGEIETLPRVHQLQIITAHVLDINVKLINLNNSFFDHGGDSVSIVTFLHELNKHGFQVNLQQLMNATSLKGFLDDLESNGYTDTDTNAVMLCDTSCNTVKEMCSRDEQIDVVYFTNLSEADVVDAAYKASLNFAAVEPISVYYKQTEHDIFQFFKGLFLKCKENLSSYACVVKVNNTIMGAALTFPHNKPIEMDFRPCYLDFLEYCEKQCVESLEKIYGNMLYCFAIYADLQLSGELRITVYNILNDEVTNIAKGNAHDAIYTLNTNPATQALDVEIHGYAVMREIDPKKYIEDGKHVFETIDDNYKIQFCVKYFMKQNENI